MPLSVRLPLRVEQKLAEYCVESGQTRTEVVTRALDGFLEAPPAQTLYERAIAAGYLKEPGGKRVRRTPSATNDNVRAFFRMSKAEQRAARRGR